MKLSVFIPLSLGLFSSVQSFPRGDVDNIEVSGWDKYPAPSTRLRRRLSSSKGHHSGSKSDASSKSEHKPKPAPTPVVSSKSMPVPPPPTPIVSSKSMPVAPPAGKGKGKGYWPPPPPPGKGKGYWPPPPAEGKGKGYWPPPPPEGKGKGMWTPPPKGKGKGGVISSKGYVPPPGKGKGYVPPPGKGKGKGYVPPPGKGKGKGYVSPPGKGKGSVPPGKGKGVFPPSAPVCEDFEITFYKSDLRQRYTTTEFGSSFDAVPFYNSNDGQLLGYYSDESTTLPSNDCVGTSAFSFGLDPYLSQINLQFTCNGAYNAITGGSGLYGCATGYEVRVDEDDLLLRSTLTVCGPLCPYVAPADE